MNDEISDSIAILNEEVRAKIAPSGLHGVGVIAIRDIQKGEKVYALPHSKKERRFYTITQEQYEKLRPEVAALIRDRWAQVLRGKSFQHPNDDAWLILFMNHSDKPNFDPKSDCALRDIVVGEEITEDYKNYKIE